jgi:hypothetical protein
VVVASLADAIKREVEWLTTSGDGLPELLKADGGPFQIVQGFTARTPNQRASAVYLGHGTYTDERWANQRKLGTYQFRAVLVWPVGGTTIGASIAEQEQQAFDDAIELLIERVRGEMFDHTHGGRFLAVAEAPVHPGITVHYAPPEQTLADGVLRAEVQYQAQDEFLI